MKKDIYEMQTDIQNLLNIYNDKWVMRKKKTNIFDAVAFRLLYTQKNKSQNIVTSTLNDFLNTKISRYSFSDRDEQITIKVYEEIYKIISKNTDKCTSKNSIYTRDIVSVDGTHSNLDRKLGQQENGFKLNKNQATCTPLISGIYNVTYNYPVTLDLVKDFNERKAFLDYKYIEELKKNSIFVFDRGYHSIKFYATLIGKDMEFVCRIRYDSFLIDKNKVDNTTSFKIYGITYKIRIITYTIDNANYYLATNLFDNSIYNVQAFKAIYHDRWSVEEYFKFLKTHFNLIKMPEKNQEKIHKMIYATMIVSKLTYFIAQLFNKRIKTTSTDTHKKKVNLSVLINGMYSKFLMRFIYGKGFNRRFVDKFYKTFVTFIIYKNGRHYERKCLTPNYRWYIKQNMTKIVSKDIISDTENKKTTETVGTIIK